jgi:hypothetical protein
MTPVEALAQQHGPGSVHQQVHTPQPSSMMSPADFYQQQQQQRIAAQQQQQGQSPVMPLPQQLQQQPLPQSHNQQQQQQASASAFPQLLSDFADGGGLGDGDDLAVPGISGGEGVDEEDFDLDSIEPMRYGEQQQHQQQGHHHQAHGAQIDF